MNCKTLCRWLSTTSALSITSSPVQYQKQIRVQFDQTKWAQTLRFNHPENFGCAVNNEINRVHTYYRAFSDILNEKIDDTSVIEVKRIARQRMEIMNSVLLSTPLITNDGLTGVKISSR